VNDRSGPAADDDLGCRAGRLVHDVSRPLPRPKTGRIAAKGNHHFGDEVMKVFGV
jgi:hypothetical protein